MTDNIDETKAFKYADNRVKDLLDKFMQNVSADAA